mmetsp:Transcript_4633/g.15327  ORF Transcript_4633/g.15327 Transcript_4633/m.15327 type:complete len:452 (-) Transcript_4633:113-1468(-)
MYLVKDGQAITTAHDDLQGFRRADVLIPFLEKFLDAGDGQVAGTAELDNLVAKHGSVVVGCFNSPEDAGVQEFELLAEKLKAHHKFAMIKGDEVTASNVAEYYEVDETPSIFVLKQLNHTLQFDGMVNDTAAVEAFVDDYAFPLIGNFSMNTYWRYINRARPFVYLFYNDDTPHVAVDAKEALMEVATEYDELSFVTIDKAAAIEGNKKLIHQVGLTMYGEVGIAMQDRSKPGTGSLTFNQLTEITPASIKAFIEEYNARDPTNRERCMVTPNNKREDDYTPDVIEKYEEWAAYEKSRLGFDDDVIREVDEMAYRKVIKKSWKDTLILYVNRWCSHAVHAEYNLRRLWQGGELDELKDELTIVVVDVVTTRPNDQSHIDSVPVMKYISARYKDFPNWYGGMKFDPESLINFIHAYHSMRHVEIPGEGPSPYSKKRDTMEEAIKQQSEDFEL